MPVPVEWNMLVVVDVSKEAVVLHIGIVTKVFRFEDKWPLACLWLGWWAELMQLNHWP